MAQLAKTRKSTSQILKFALCGVVSTAIHCLVAALLLSNMAMSLAAANALAFTAATVFSYLSNSLWTFSYKLGLKPLLRFLLVSLVGLSLSFLLSIFAESRNFSNFAGIALVVICCPLLTFLIHRFLTFR